MNGMQSLVHAQTLTAVWLNLPGANEVTVPNTPAKLQDMSLPLNAGKAHKWDDYWTGTKICLQLSIYYFKEKGFLPGSFLTLWNIIVWGVG